MSARITTECRACGWTESMRVGMVGDASETVAALWNLHDTDRPTCSAYRGPSSLTPVEAQR